MSDATNDDLLSEIAAAAGAAFGAEIGAEIGDLADATSSDSDVVDDGTVAPVRFAESPQVVTGPPSVLVLTLHNLLGVTIPAGTLLFSATWSSESGEERSDQGELPEIPPDGASIDVEASSLADGEWHTTVHVFSAGWSGDAETAHFQVVGGLALPGKAQPPGETPPGETPPGETPPDADVTFGSDVVASDDGLAFFVENLTGEELPTGEAGWTLGIFSNDQAVHTNNGDFEAVPVDGLAALLPLPELPDGRFTASPGIFTQQNPGSVEVAHCAFRVANGQVVPIDDDDSESPVVVFETGPDLAEGGVSYGGTNLGEATAPAGSVRDTLFVLSDDFSVIHQAERLVDVDLEPGATYAGFFPVADVGPGEFRFVVQVDADHGGPTRQTTLKVTGDRSDPGGGEEDGDEDVQNVLRGLIE